MKEALIIVCCLSFLAILIYFSKMVLASIRKLKNRTEAQSTIQLLSTIDNLIKSNVIATNQTMVNDLKRSGVFYQQDREEAFETTRSKVLLHVKPEFADTLKQNINNLDAWISNRIEYHVYMQKKAQK